MMDPSFFPMDPLDSDNSDNADANPLAEKTKIKMTSKHKKDTVDAHKPEKDPDPKGKEKAEPPVLKNKSEPKQAKTVETEPLIESLKLKLDKIREENERLTAELVFCRFIIIMLGV
jgi:hypothetical protein